MAVTATISNHAKYQMAAKQIDLTATGDAIKLILMNTTFTFDKDAHATLSDVTSDQLATEYGYTQDNITLSNQALTEDDTDDNASFTADDVTITASGGDIGPTGAYILYDDSTADDTILACVDFGTDHTIGDGLSLRIQNIEITIT